MLLFFRLGMGLPGLSVEQPIGIGDSFQRTSAHMGILFQVTLIASAILTVASLPALVSFPGSWVVSLALSWFTTVFSLSLLTTAYGVIIEGRELG